MSLHVVALVVILYGTAPLVYSYGRYAWFYKTIGVVQYINANGQLNSHIDIYQNWPGFFALAAWFGKVAGVASPLGYAKWAQLVFELAALPLLYLAYDALSLTVRQRWVALLLYASSNWIGQDYYSPQGLGTLLSLGVMAIAMRWLYVGNNGRLTGGSRRSDKHRGREPGQENLAALSRQEIWEAYREVRTMKGPPGTDGVTIDDFERDLGSNLDTIWKRMSSGSCSPAPVRVVPQPGSGGTAMAGVLTIGDKVMQMVVSRRLQVRAAQIMHRHPGAGADQRATATRDGWVIELNMEAFFARCRHDLLLKVMEASTELEWVVLYVQRWLKAPVQHTDGSLRERDQGTLPGFPISSVLADLFLDSALDSWMTQTFPEVIFERQLDEAQVHCTSEQQALMVREAIGQRMEEAGLKLHPSKIRIAGHRDSVQKDGRDDASYDFLYSPAVKSPPGETANTTQASLLSRWQLPPAAARPTLFCAALLLIYFVLSFTHELSPYLVVLQVGALAAAGRLRPRWLPIALLAIAIGYLLPRLAYVNSHYGLLSSIGSFFSNAAPPESAGTTSLAVSQHLIQRAELLLSLGMWILALAGAWLRRRSGRTDLALIVLTFSPACILFAQAYGNEGVLRVYLFSLPWAAALAASALEPVAALASRSRSRLSAASSIVFDRRTPVLGALRVPLVLGLVLALFFPAFFGDDSFNAMSKTEVETIASFLQTARVGPVYCAIDNAPVQDTAKYNMFPILAVFGTLGGPPVITQAKPDIANVIAQNSKIYTDGKQPAYVLVSPSMIAHSQAYGETPPDSFTILLTSLAHSRAWKLIADRGGTIIYELPPTKGS
jgi:retron-type reverse transcriptase